VKIVSVVGARPQFVKLAPICRVMPSHIDHTIIHSGQHYDDALSKDLFDELLIPRPALNFQVGSGSHAEQTARILIDAEKAWGY
jgi:UDP-N-acetylglucosamine 2-epimerase (non-hydrolysing)